MSFDNQSYWEKKNFFDVDIVIIGSGIVGLNAAITIKSLAPKLRVMVVERGFLPSGASTKNAGFACFGSISELIEQEKAIGTDNLHQLIEKRWKGLLKLRNMLGDDKISFQRFGGYEIFRPEDYKISGICVSKLSHFNALVNDIVSQKNVYSEANYKISEFGFRQIKTLIENKLEAQIDPGLLIKSLLQKAAQLEVMIYNSCDVLKINEDITEIKLETNQGEFCCKKLLIANNAFVNQFLPDLDVIPGRGQVIVTQQIPNLKVKGTFHYERGYYYFRNIDNRVLIGGGRNIDFKKEETTAFGTTPIVQNALLKLLTEVVLPGTDIHIEHQWSGIMAFGTHLSPIVEEIRPHIFVAVRCNGMGIAIGSHTGEEIGTMMVNRL